MNHSTPFLSAGRGSHYSPRACLAAIGLWIQQDNLFQPIAQMVTIRQKTLKHTPAQKLYDGFISVLAGARGLVQINKRLRSDPALQRAFGRRMCAEPSVVEDTFDACTQENVQQMQQALTVLYRRHSQGFRHDYQAHWQMLDVDLRGLPCGKKAEFATKGYFAHQRHRRGRQLGRVFASDYREIVCEQLFDGTTQLRSALLPLVQQAQQVLELTQEQRHRTILRVDSGGGTVEDINGVLTQGYQFHGKDYSGARAQCLAESVRDWVDDPKVAGRQVGWVTAPDRSYVRPVFRIAVRCRKLNGQWGVGVLVSTLSAQDVILLTHQPIHRAQDPTAVLLAYVLLYDTRGGGVETALKEDKQGLELGQRNKRRFAAQQRVILLSTLAHNVIVWA